MNELAVNALNKNVMIRTAPKINHILLKENLLCPEPQEDLAVFQQKQIFIICETGC